MEKYISKSTVVAEIEDWRNKIKNGIFSIPLTSRDRADATFEYEILGKVIDLLSTIEVKEVDLEKEIEEVKHNYKVDDNRHTSICSADIEWLAEHFFELGTKATQKGE